MDVDFEALGRDLSRAIESVLKRYKEANSLITKSGLLITFVEELEHSYAHKWPEETQVFSTGKWYHISGEGLPEHGLRVLVAKSERDVWSKLRPMKIVFGKLETSGEIKQLIPYAEFLADDIGTFCSEIPNPLRPSEAVKRYEFLPEHYKDRVVKRNDQLFLSVKKGPVLRIVVEELDEISMIEHGVLVASLRERF